MAAAQSHMWYVQAAGRVWGPYPDARVADFALEGRVSAATPVSPFPGGPFTPAGRLPEFAPLLLSLAESSRPAAQPAPAEPAPRAPEPAAATAAQSGPARTLLVWAELSAETLRAFPAALAAFGPGVAVRPGLWLVQARMAPSALRNLLSRRLGAGDSLLVVEAGIDQAAWFNLEPGRDRELRRLWAAPVRA